MEESTARTVIKILAVLSFVGTAGCLLLAGLFAFAGSLVASGSVPELASLGPSAGIIVGVLALLFLIAAIYDLFVGVGLWRFRNWGRVLFLISAWIGIPFGLVALIFSVQQSDVGGIVGQVVGLFISIVLIWFFQFNEVVRGIFGVSAPVATPAVATEAKPAAQPEAMMLAPATTETAAPASTTMAPEAIVTQAPAARASTKRAPAKRAKKPAKKSAKKAPVKKAPKKAAKKKK